MSVKQLIEKLLQLNQEKEVFVASLTEMVPLRIRDVEEVTEENVLDEEDIGQYYITTE